MRTVLPLAAIVLLTPLACRADLPDYEYQQSVVFRLQKLNYKPFAIYSQLPNEGYIDLNDGKIFWGSSARVLVPPGWYKRTEVSSREGPVTRLVEVRGWQSDGAFDPVRNMAFVNVGWSTVRAGDETLRKGDYVVYDGSRFVKGTFRQPERVRIEPRDTNRDKSSELLTQAYFSLNVKDAEAARSLFKSIALDYPDTTAAEKSLAALRRIGESGPLQDRKEAADSDEVPESVFIKEDGQTDDDAAAHLLCLAKTFRATRQEAKSRKVLQGLVDRYPNSKAGERGAALLESMK